MGLQLDTCGACRASVAADGPAVGTGGDGSFVWVPFVEDLTTTGLRLLHPACFAGQYGIDALIRVVHEHDWRVRRDTWELIHRLEQ